MKISKIILVFYFICGITFILLERFETGIIVILTKSLIIPSLIVYFYFVIQDYRNTLFKLISFALVFSWIGDITLQLTMYNENFFIIGLCAFLITQLIYSIAFFSTTGKKSIIISRPYLLIPVIGYGFGLIFYLYDGLGDKTIPVIIYSLVILLMLTAVINRYGRVISISFYYVLIGAVLFVISDSLIAINRFKYPFDLARVIIMSLYILAQFLIVSGCIKQLKSRSVG